MSAAAVGFSQTADRKTPVLWIVVHIVRHKLLIGAFLLCMGGNAALAAVVPVLVGVALNAALATPPNLSLIAWAAFGILTSQVVRAAVQFGRVYASAVLGERVEQDTREEIYVSLLGKSIAFHRALPSGEAMAWITNDIHELNLMIKMGIGVVAASASFLLTPVLLAPQYHPLLVLAPLLFLAGYTLIVARYLHVLHSAADHARLTFGTMNRRLVETLEGIEMVKGMAQEAQEIASFEEHASAYRDAAVAQGRVEARFFALLLLGVVEGLGFGHALLLCSKTSALNASWAAIASTHASHGREWKSNRCCSRLLRRYVYAYHPSGAQKTVKILYTAKATVQGGRNGQAQSSDGPLQAHLSVPKEMG